MPRKLRVEYPGAIYHVMNRGDRQEPIFLDEEDRRLFLTNLGGVLRENRMGGACVLTDAQSFSFGHRNTERQSGGWDEVVSWYLHREVQPAA